MLIIRRDNSKKRIIKIDIVTFAPDLRMGIS